MFLLLWAGVLLLLLLDKQHAIEQLWLLRFTAGKINGPTALMLNPMFADQSDRQTCLGV